MFSNWPNSMTATPYTILSMLGLPVRTRIEYFSLLTCRGARGATCVLTVEHPPRIIKHSMARTFMRFTEIHQANNVKSPRLAEPFRLTRQGPTHILPDHVGSR